MEEEEVKGDGGGGVDKRSHNKITITLYYYSYGIYIKF